MIRIPYRDPDQAARLVSLLEENILVMDGAMGTMIQDKQLQEQDYRGDETEAAAVDIENAWPIIPNH